MNVRWRVARCPLSLRAATSKRLMPSTTGSEAVALPPPRGIETVDCPGANARVTCAMSTTFTVQGNAFPGRAPDCCPSGSEVVRIGAATSMNTGTRTAVTFDAESVAAIWSQDRRAARRADGNRRGGRIGDDQVHIHLRGGEDLPRRWRDHLEVRRDS